MSNSIQASLPQTALDAPLTDRPHISRQPATASSTPLSFAQKEAQLSSASTALGGALALSDVRMDKVNALKSIIDNGEYSISSADIANRLIDNMLE